MRFGEEFLQELKSRIRPSDIIGKTVMLKRRGKEFVGLSPFTQEKTPSFFVNDMKGFYHCFSSGEHGDVIDFLMKSERLSFSEAIEVLAAEAGMTLPSHEYDIAETAQKKAYIARLKTCVQHASEFFRANLKDKKGETARQYLLNRGLQPAIWDEFEIGYALPSRMALNSYLQQKGVSRQTMIDAGLVIKPEYQGQAYDRFRDRIIFPIHNIKGECIAFGGRSLNKTAKAKYLNSPETPLFHKGENLYRYYQARKSINFKSLKEVILVEGYMDVIALVEAGFLQTISPLGTALTKTQLSLIWKMSNEPILFFDGDQAGMNAASRAIDLALPMLTPGLSLKFILTENGQDPDDLLRSEGKQGIHTRVKQSAPLVDALWQRELMLKTLNTPEQKAEFKERLLNIISQIEHKEVKTQYKNELLNRFYDLFRKSKTAFVKPPYFASPQLKALRLHSKTPVIIRYLIGGIIYFPEILFRVEEKFIALNIKERQWDEYRHRIYNVITEYEQVQTTELLKQSELADFKEQTKQIKQDYPLMLAELGGKKNSIENRVIAWIHLYNRYHQIIQDDDQKQLIEEIDKGDIDRIKSFILAKKKKEY